MRSNGTLKKRLLSGALTLALIIGLLPTVGGMAAPQKVHAASVNATLSFDGTYYVDGYPSRHWYANVDGPSPQKTAYCIQPTKGPDTGSSEATELSDAHRLSQAMYYCQGYPGWGQALAWLQDQSWSDYWLDADRGNGYAIGHYALSIIWGQDDFRGQISDTHYNQAEAFARYLESRPAPPTDTSVNVTPASNTGIWLADQTGYKAGTYTFTCNAGNHGNYTVPAGFKLINLNTGVTYNAGSNVDLANGVRFEIVDMTGDRSGGDTWTSADIESNLNDYTAYRFNADSNFQDLVFFAELQGESANFSINYQNRSRASIVKFISDGQDINFEAGAKFQIHNTTFSSYEDAETSEFANAATITTDSNGSAVSPYLVPGTYLVHQIDGDKNHKYMEDKTIVLTADGTTYKVEGNAAGINDELLQFSLKVIKVDATTGRTIPIAGVGFRIMDSSGNWVKLSYTKEDENGNYVDVTEDEFFTNRAGIMMTPGKLKAGTYTLHETSAPEGYVLNTEPMTIVLNQDTEVLPNNVAEFKFQNDPQKGRVDLTKVGEMLSIEDGKLVTGNQIAVPYAVFDIVAAEDIITPDGTVRAKKGDVVHKGMRTDQAGKATSDEFYLGKYHIYETGIMMRIDQHTFTSDDLAALKDYYMQAKLDIASSEEIEAFDRIINGKVTINSKGMMSDDSGRVITDMTTRNVIMDYISTLPADQIETTMVDDTDTPYDIPEDPVASVEIKYSNHNTITTNHEVKVVNRPAVGTVEITKSDVSDGKLLPNTGLQILDQDKNIIVKGRTDEKGKVTFGPLPVGQYYLQEFDAPEGYKIDSSLFPFEIKENGEIVKCRMTNVLEDGGVEITKTDITDGKVLPNTGIEIADKDKKVIRKGRTDENGKVTFKELPDGVYYFREFDAPEGYILDTSFHKFTVEAGKITKCQMTNTPRGNAGYVWNDSDPQTGDDFSLLPYILAALIAGTTAAILLIRRKRLKVKE